MPNWCQNSLTIIGPKDVLDEIAATGLSLAKLIPVPEELQKMEKKAPIPKSEIKERARLKKKYGVDTAFDWQVTSWGTKWDIDVGEITVEASYGKKGVYEISVSFDSAWSPPVNAMKTIYDRYSKRGLKVWMEYFEPGCRFLGTITTMNGKFVDDYREYSNADELEKYVKELDHSLAENECDYVRELEEEYSEKVETLSVPTPKKKRERTKSMITIEVIPLNSLVEAISEPVRAKKAAAKKPTTKKIAAKKPAVRKSK